MLQGLLKKPLMEIFLKETIIATILKKDDSCKSWEDTKDAMS